jgi:hypothetical protein|tara:strand:+ start:4648 stop:5109 length:462 start_codon:yes stop_codon:yes gene_type:complete
MITILGSLIGFAGSALPKVFDMFQDYQDRKHELQVMDRQVEQAKMLHGQKIEALNIEADISESKALYKHDASMQNTGFIGGLRSSVRPVITYLFFTLFAVIKGVALFAMIYTADTQWEIAVITLWDEETQGIFSAIIAFWFGSRALQRSRSTS